MGDRAWFLGSAPCIVYVSRLRIVTILRNGTHTSPTPACSSTRQARLLLAPPCSTRQDAPRVQRLGVDGLQDSANTRTHSARRLIPNQTRTEMGIMAHSAIST